MEAASALKAAAVLAQNKDKIRKGVVIVILIVALPILLIVMCFLEIMSAFTPDGVLKSAEYFDGADSAIYRSLTFVTEPFYEQLEEQMEKMKDQIIEDYTYEYEVIGEDGKPKKEKNVPKVTMKLHYVPENIIIAYLLQVEALDTQTAVIDEAAATVFLNAICSIKQTNLGDNRFLLENELFTIEEIANLYFTKEMEKTRYKITCEAYAEYFDVAKTEIIEDGSTSIDGIFTENLSSVPLYLQYDPAWASNPYGNGTIRKNGCCPTCLAMVFSYFNGESVYPTDVVAWAGNRYYVDGTGTSWGIFAPAGAQWGVKCTNIGKSAGSMQQALADGKLVIASMGPGTFTKGGHFIVLTGITGDGKIRVNDPNDNASKQHVNQSFEVSLILRECKNMWAFER